MLIKYGYNGSVTELFAFFFFVFLYTKNINWFSLNVAKCVYILGIYRILTIVNPKEEGERLFFIELK